MGNEKNRHGQKLRFIIYNIEKIFEQSISFKNLEGNVTGFRKTGDNSETAS